MDGVMDSPGYQIAAGGKLYAAVRGTTLYVAAPATDANDQFILITDIADHPAMAPWGKNGQVAFDPNAKPFLAQNGATRAISWSVAGAGNLCPNSVSLGWMEGSIDLENVFSALPETISICLARYASGNGGVLIAASQIPAGNGDDNIDVSEFLRVPISTLRDEDSDGVLDVLGSNPGFPASFTNNPGVFAVRWPAVPGQTYRVIAFDKQGDPMLPLSGPMLCSEGTFNLSYSDYPPASVSQRFYRVENMTRQ